MVTVRVQAEELCATFSCGPGERILYSGLAAGLPLPYECASGTCGKYRATLVEGEVRDLWPGAPARSILRAAKREVLMCQSAPTCDVTLSIARKCAGGAHLPRAMEGCVAQITPLAPDVLEMRVRLDSPMRFNAGQFILLEAPAVEGPRAYSMVNYDAPADTLRLVLRRKESGGLSRWAFDRAHAGERVRVFGPLGTASFDSSLADVLCIAGGTGIAGMVSILRSAIAHGHAQRHRVDLFFGVRTPRDLFIRRRAGRAQGAGGGERERHRGFFRRSPRRAFRPLSPAAIRERLGSRSGAGRARRETR
jgi:toluene monooxygenase electron transfer component